MTLSLYVFTHSKDIAGVPMMDESLVTDSSAPPCSRGSVIVRLLVSSIPNVKRGILSSAPCCSPFEQVNVAVFCE